MSHKFKESVAPKCPPGYVLRRSFTTKDGTFVPARCIVERGIFPKNMQNANEAKKKEIEKKINKLCKENDCAKKCPKGQILREGYEREAYTKEDGTFVEATLVPPECIKNQGKPGKGPKLIQLSDVDHILSDHGYKDVKSMNEKKRHEVLMKVIRAVTRDYGKRQAMIYVIKALTARATLTKTGSPNSSKAFTEDHEWVSGLLKEWKEKHGDEKKDKKKARLILLGPTDHILSMHGYVNISGLSVEKRHKILKKVLKDMIGMKGEADAYKTLIKELVARSNLGMTKSPESSKFMKRDADWISELYSAWKEKHGNKKKHAKLALVEKKKGKLELVEKKKGQKIKLSPIKNTKPVLLEKIKNITKK